MDNYEIRIVKRDLAITVHRSEHINDHAAIRRGHVLAEAGDQVEIWRGTQCVYAGQQGPAVAQSHFQTPHPSPAHGGGNNV
jgi:hypothetical protein